MSPKRKARTSRGEVSPKGPPRATIRPVNTKGLERVYANFVRVSHTAIDFTVTFCELPSPSELQELEDKVKKTGVIEAPVVCRVALPIELMPILIETFRVNLSRFEESRKEASERKEENSK